MSSDRPTDTAACPYCRDGYFDGSETECINGVLIDVDEAHEGWQLDVIYPPAPCCAAPDGDWPDGIDQSQERLADWAALGGEVINNAE